MRGRVVCVVTYARENMARDGGCCRGDLAVATAAPRGRRYFRRSRAIDELVDAGWWWRCRERRWHAGGSLPPRCHGHRGGDIFPPRRVAPPVALRSRLRHMSRLL